MTSSSLARRLVPVRADMPPAETPTGTPGRILSAAVGLFSERGFAGTAIRDLAAAADIGSATLYAHFATKEHILAELLRIGYEHHLRVLNRALLEAGTEPADQLSALVRAHVSGHAEYPRLAIVVNHELDALGGDLAAPIVVLRREIRRVVTDVVMRGVERGDFRTAEPELAIIAIGSMGLRVANWWDADGPFSVERVAATYAEFALAVVDAADTPRSPHTGFQDPAASKSHT